MADTEYTVKLIDQSRGAGRRVERALAGVDTAARRTAASISSADRAERAASKTAEKLARAELKLSRALFGTSRAAITNSRAMGRVAAMTNKAKGSVSRFSKTLSGVGAFASAAGAAMALRLGAGAVTAGVAMVKANGEAELLRDTFNRVAGNKSEFPEIQKQVRALGLDLVEGEKAALKLRAVFGKTTTSKFLDFFKATNLDSSEITRASLALSQIQGRGKLQGEELNQFAEAVPGFNRGQVIASIAKELKISLAAAGKKLKSGQVSAQVGIKALFEGSLKSLKIDDLAAQLKKVQFSTPARLARIGNEITDAKRAIGQALDNTPFLGILEKTASGVSGLIKSLGKDQLGAIISALAISFGVLTTAIVGMGIAAGIAWLAVAAPAVLVVAAVSAIAGAVFLLFKSFQRFSDLGGFTDLWSILKVDSPKITMFLTDVWRALTSIFNVLTAIGKASVFGDFSDLSGIANRLTGGLIGSPDPGAGLDFQSAQDVADGTAAEVATAGSAGPSRAALANVGASAGAAANSSAKTGGSVGKVEVNIQVDGSGDPTATGAAVKESFETGIVSFFERHLEGVGA